MTIISIKFHNKFLLISIISIYLIVPYKNKHNKYLLWGTEI